MRKRGWWLLALHAFLPGSPQIIAGNRRLGRIGITAILSLYSLIALAIALALINRSIVVWIATTIPLLLWLIGALLLAFAVLYAILAIDTIRLVQLARLYRRDSWIVGLSILLVGTLGTSALAYAGNIATASNDVLGTVFQQSGGTEPVDGRFNILLLGADSGKHRFGIRPDSISVISIDAETGETVNIGIPRNLQRVPFSADSPLLSIYPNGWNCGVECLINAIYKDTEDNHADLFPDAIKNGSTPGIEATKDAVEGVTGLTIQSYVLVDMAGFRGLIDALGGIDINVRERLPIGGGEDANGQPINVKGWIEPGFQHLTGYRALWYARARHGSSDYARMARQREVENAVLAQIEPATILTRFQEIAKAGELLVKTDIPRGMLSRYLELATKIKAKGITPLELVPPTIDVIHPNFTEIQAMIKKAFKQVSPTP